VLGGYLQAHLRVAAAGQDCPLQGAVQPLAATDQFRRFELRFRCATDKDIELQSHAFFELVPSHVTLAQIETADGNFVEQLFTKDSQTYTIGSKDTAMPAFCSTWVWASITFSPASITCRSWSGWY
jgi:hypothetical protein